MLLNSSLISSQLKMEGKVTDSLKNPLELANIILINSETNALESFAISGPSLKLELDFQHQIH